MVFDWLPQPDKACFCLVKECFFFINESIMFSIKLTDVGKTKVKLYIVELKVERKEIIDAKSDTVDELKKKPIARLLL
ncbi:hypothetical protein [Pseudobutyrivibrio sp.]|uniref:hypothetical protein n=1 Tax=Pseudobutyrivibrio sp. TaxID=2014367 RepID=UPI0025D69A8A|nr:hypothetical protein [Pseudobutyrivibrio sp.]